MKEKDMNVPDGEREPQWFEASDLGLSRGQGASLVPLGDNERTVAHHVLGVMMPLVRRSLRCLDRAKVATRWRELERNRDKGIRVVYDIVSDHVDAPWRQFQKVPTDRLGAVESAMADIGHAWESYRAGSAMGPTRNMTLNGVPLNDTSWFCVLNRVAYILLGVMWDYVSDPGPGDGSPMDLFAMGVSELGAAVFFCAWYT